MNVRERERVDWENSVSTPWGASTVSQHVRRDSDSTQEQTIVRTLMSAGKLTNQKNCYVESSINDMTAWGWPHVSTEPPVSTPWAHSHVSVAPVTRRWTVSARTSTSV